MSVANASQHLQVLRAAQLVEVRREGLSIYYRLADERVLSLWQAMHEVGEARIAEIERIVQIYLHERTLLQPISATELRQRLSEGNVILLDVRPVEEYQAAHLPGALSMPVTDLNDGSPFLHRELRCGQSIGQSLRGPAGRSPRAQGGAGGWLVGLPVPLLIIFAPSWGWVVFAKPLVQGFAWWVVAMVLLGLGTALVYPTLLAAVSDVAHPDWRASAVGVSRLWRDSGYAIGALLADLFGVSWAIGVIAGVTFLSGVVAQDVMRETLPRKEVAKIPTI